VLLALLFFVSETTKVTETAGIEGYMQAYGVPGVLMWPAAAWECIAGALLLVGLYLRPVSVLLAGWCVLTAVIFHTKFFDLDQLMNFFKNMTMAGGFLILAKRGSWGASVDAVFASHRLRLQPGITAARRPDRAPSMTEEEVR
jgi:putative oxidoreductase